MSKIPLGVKCTAYSTGAEEGVRTLASASALRLTPTTRVQVIRVR